MVSNIEAGLLRAKGKRNDVFTPKELAAMQIHKIPDILVRALGMRGGEGRGGKGREKRWRGREYTK